MSDVSRGSYRCRKISLVEDDDDGKDDAKMMISVEMMAVFVVEASSKLKGLKVDFNGRW